MKKSLEDVIREQATKGNLSHFGIALSPSGKTWTASYAPTKVSGVSFCEHEDPIEAIRGAFDHMLKRRAANAPVRREDAQDFDFG